MVNYGQYDPNSLLPIRVTDFLRSLDTIVDTAIERQVDLVLFAGDTYKDRNPHPTFQREWGRRIMRLSQAGIPTLLLVGNHDVSPAAGRAHTIAEFDTLQVPHVTVADQIRIYGPADLGLPLQIVTIPWIPRSQFMTRAETAGKPMEDIRLCIEEKLTERVVELLNRTDANLPTVLAAHASVTGAKHGSERMAMLGSELILGQALLRHSRLDYVALGHIHKHQDLNVNGHPPVVYAGSIERMDFGEAEETKGFVLAHVAKGETNWEFIPLQTRPFVDWRVSLQNAETVTEDILAGLPPPEELKDAVVRLHLTYPTEWEALIDDAAIQRALEPALESRVIKNRQGETRARLGDTAAVETLSPIELLARYWKTVGTSTEEADRMRELAMDIIRSVDENGS
jgi:exonuclease SbcD